MEIRRVLERSERSRTLGRGGGHSVRREDKPAAGRVDGPAGSSSAPCRALGRGQAKPRLTCKLSRALQ